MYQLTYRSGSLPGLREEHLEAILEEARKRNRQESITGCLVYYQDSFVQILEGDKKSVLRLYAKIKLDTRHRSIQLLWEGDVDQRYFPDWHMAYYYRSEALANEKGEDNFVNNMSILSDLSPKSTSPLLSFWATVRGFLNGRPKLDSF